MNFNFKWPKHTLRNIPQITTNINSQVSSNKINSEKEKQLTNLKTKIMSEKNIIFSYQAKNFVFYDGNINSSIMLIGEAPGEEEDLQGIPFVGRSGQLLRFFLSQAKIDEFYITNILPWRLPNNRPPTSEEIQIMTPYLKEHIKIIQPKIIILIGTSALKSFNINETITNIQGKLLNKDQYTFFPIYHPSYAIRLTNKKKDLWISLLQLKKILKEINN